MRSEHRGHEIAFDADREVWGCATLGLENASLKALKRAIDGESKKRRTVNVECYHLQDYWRGEATLKKVVICLLREGDKKCDVRDATDKKDKDGRSQVDIHELYPIEAKPLLDLYMVAKLAERKAEAAVEKAKDKLEPLTAKTVREIVARQADEATT